VEGSGSEVSWARGAPARAARGIILRGLIGPLVTVFGSPQVQGAGSLGDLEEPVIFAANHSSHMDTPTILLALPRTLRKRTLVVAAADYFYRNKLVGAMVSLAIGTIPLERQRPGAESIQFLQALLADGWNILAFPEGSRSRDGRLYRGKTGIARIALVGHVPVVPVGVRGTFDILPHDRKFPKRAPVVVRFGKPLRFDRFYDQPTDRFVLRSVTDEIMYEIMTLSDQEYVDRYAYKPEQAGQPTGSSSKQLVVLPAEPSTNPLQDGSAATTQEQS
jgi:1-acyl-sn-glycerol-3-phosphate acyltransferase